jgi:hypothetical protein
MKIHDKEYPQIGQFATKEFGAVIPVAILNIPMMSDEKWRELTAKQKAERETQ